MVLECIATSFNGKLVEKFVRIKFKLPRNTASACRFPACFDIILGHQQDYTHDVCLK